MKDRVFLIQAVDSGEKLRATIPPGEYYVGDPCYVLGKELYDALHEQIFPGWSHESRDIEIDVQLDTGGKARMVDVRTAHGDGSYDIRTEKKTYRAAVDSGGLAVIDRRLCDANKYTEERIKEIATFVTVTAEAVLRTEGGNLRLEGYFTLLTDPPEHTDDD